MIESGKGGSIINIASMSGHIGMHCASGACRKLRLLWPTFLWSQVNYPQPQAAYNACKCIGYKLRRYRL